MDEGPNEKASAGTTLSLRAVEPVNVSVKDLCTAIEESHTTLQKLRGVFGKQHEAKNIKTILENVDAELSQGKLTAILGGSGSGKTTLLNVLSRRIASTRMKTSGTVLYNESTKLSAIRSAYVMQNDVLIPTLTVRETLRYAADLRLPPPTTTEERRQIVEEVILELGLKECASTRIGNSARKGCSGGEKRRTSLGVQMLANPSLLFLDEVTTGLDATSAFQLVRTLKMLASKGRTIIMTIHQPRSEIFGFFDNIVLLSGGSPLFSGPSKNCLTHFENLGFKLPMFVNPAEFLIDLSVLDIRSTELEQASGSRIACLKDAWAKKRMLPTPESDMSGTTLRPVSKIYGPLSGHGKASLGRQTSVLTRRTFKTTIRDPMGMLGSLMEATSMAFINGWIFYQLSESLAGIRSREGALYTACGLQGYLILIFETYRLSVDIELFDRENREGVVSVLAFLLSRRFSRVLLEDLPVPLIFSCIYYFMVGFRTEADQFFTFFAIMLLVQYIAVCQAALCVAISRSFAGASLIANMSYTLQSLGCGYFVQANQIPVYMRWLKWTAYNFYAFGALCANEFIGHTSSPTGELYACPESGGASNPACAQYTGTYIMGSLGLPKNWIWRPILFLAAYVFAFYAGAGLILKFLKQEIGVSKAQNTEADIAAGKEDLQARSPEELRRLEITLTEYTLKVQRRHGLRSQGITKSILRSVNATFLPGQLNVIMGPSGSGKTSLLNSLASRLSNDASSTYIKEGTMLLNGAIPSESVVRSIVGYVCQDDDALLPFLTVRENLHFAAGLRLPQNLSKQQKIARAEDVLMRLGLRDCANNLIGGELVKGISGGEKRRVTIAIQILTDPKILLLDEPTSGLDAFTATSIIEVLQGLANEGRTLVMTIHQSRSDFFKSFGTILLLARGGSVAYAGKGSDMLPYFSSLGHECPKATNPTDFALDLITIDLQSPDREASTRTKVQNLLESWSKTSHSLSRTTSKIMQPAELGSYARSPTPFLIALPLLLHRSFINFKRNPPSVIARTVQVISFGIILALFFAPLKSDPFSVQSRLGFIQETAAIYFIGMLQNIPIYPVEKQVFYREHDDNAYGVGAFFVQYTIAEIPFEIFSSLVFSVLGSIATGLGSHRSVKLFFIVAFNCFCVTNCGESLGIVFNTFFDNTGFAVNMTSVLLSLATTMGGVMSLEVPSFLNAFNRLSPVYWSLGNLAPYTLQGVKFTCQREQRDGMGNCPIETGEQVLRLYGLEKNAGLNILALGITTVVYRLLAFLILAVKKRRAGGESVVGRWGGRAWMHFRS